MNARTMESTFSSATRAGERFGWCRLAKRPGSTLALLLGLAIAVFPALLPAAQVYNLVSNFDQTYNPSASGWSYGYKASSSGTFTLLSWAGWNYYDTGYMGWTVSSATRYPEVNRDATTVQACPTTVPGLVGIRWTANTNGIASVSASFKGYWTSDGPGYTIAGAYVFTNGAQNFESDINNSSSALTIAYQSNIVVRAGDTIDFMVGPNSQNTLSWARTFVTAIISLVPTPTVTLTPSANPTTYGGNVTLTATLSTSAATGTVTFKDGATTLGSANLSGGTATYSTSSPTAGSHSLTAIYSGDSNFNASTSDVLTQTVNKALPVITTWPSASAITYGQTLASSSLTGGSGSPAGSFAWTTSSTAPAAGTAAQSMTYTPTDAANYSATNYTVSVTVNPAGTTNGVVSSANPSLPGHSVTFTATVGAVAPGSGIPTNRVRFLTNGIPAATNYLDAAGVAAHATAFLSHGSNAVTAEYLGDGNFTPSTSAVVGQVINTPPTASNLALGGKRGQAVHLVVVGGKHPPEDVDPGDAATLQLTAVTQGSYGTVAADGTGVTYTGTGGDSGTDSFTYTVSDNYGGTAVATVAVTLSGSGQGFNLVGATPLADGQVRLTYVGVPGYRYALDRADNLAYPIPWIPQVTNQANSLGQIIFTNQPDGATNNFWRTRHLP